MQGVTYFPCPNSDLTTVVTIILGPKYFRKGGYGSTNSSPFVGMRSPFSVEANYRHRFRNGHCCYTSLTVHLVKSNPIWVEQWSLKGEKLQQAHLLVEEHLELGHINLLIAPEILLFLQSHPPKI